MKNIQNIPVVKCEKCNTQRPHQIIGVVSFLTKLRSFKVTTMVCLACNEIKAVVSDEKINEQYTIWD
jgi:uncharacterized protein with PIN domain